LSGIPEASPPPAASTSGRRVVTPTNNALLSQTARPVTPGPNAFAIHAAEAEAHRLRSNAFYQQATTAENARQQAVQDQEMAGLELTPPTAVHPALRENFRLGDSSPTPNLMANQMAVTQAESTTPFNSLKLIPEEGCQGKPTGRNFIEGIREELEPKNSVDETGRTPVFKYTPKLRSSEFSKPAGPATPQKKKGGVFNWIASEDQEPGSPKKGFLEKLKLTTARTRQAPTSTSVYSVKRGDSGGEALPPKAKAVLSTNPQNFSLGRSPSKKLGMFARKASDAVFSSEMTKTRRSLGANEQQATNTATRKVNFSAFVGSKTPARELRPRTKRYVSQPQRQLRPEKGEDKLATHADVNGVFQPQRLQYFDRENPPTPPAKDTPPHEKKLKTEKEEADRILKAQHDESDRILEAHKALSENQAEVVKKMSLRKSVVTDAPRREMQQKPDSKLTSALDNRVFEDDTPMAVPAPPSKAATLASTCRPSSSRGRRASTPCTGHYFPLRKKSVCTMRSRNAPMNLASMVFATSPRTITRATPRSITPPASTRMIGAPRPLSLRLRQIPCTSLACSSRRRLCLTCSNMFASCRQLFQPRVRSKNAIHHPRSPRLPRSLLWPRPGLPAGARARAASQSFTRASLPTRLE
jgi:hypothetical protein